MEAKTDRAWLRHTVRRADSGNEDSMATLDGMTGRELEDIGARHLEELAAEGSPWATLLLGRILEERAETPGDQRAAEIPYRDAACKRNPYAMVSLARMFGKGECMGRSFHNEYVRYSRAAEIGCPPAERWMEENGERGRCMVDLDEKCDEEEPGAMYETGLLFESGE